MVIGKHSEAALKIKQLENELYEKESIISRKDKEIKDIKQECAEQFEKIKNLCYINDYGDKYAKLRKIFEIASDNFSALVKDIVIDQDEKGKIIELSTAGKSSR